SRDPLIVVMRLIGFGMYAFLLVAGALRVPSASHGTRSVPATSAISPVNPPADTHARDAARTPPHTPAPPARPYAARAGALRRYTRPCRDAPAATPAARRGTRASPPSSPSPPSRPPPSSAALPRR